MINGIITGPIHWGEKFSGCVGKHQSPIDISVKNVQIIKLGDIIFDNFMETPEEATITNNGHTGKSTVSNITTINYCVTPQ